MGQCDRVLKFVSSGGSRGQYSISNEILLCRSSAATPFDYSHCLHEIRRLMFAYCAWLWSYAIIILLQKFYPSILFLNKWNLCFTRPLIMSIIWIPNYENKIVRLNIYITDFQFGLLRVNVIGLLNVTVVITPSLIVLCWQLKCLSILNLNPHI